MTAAQDIASVVCRDSSCPCVDHQRAGMWTVLPRERFTAREAAVLEALWPPDRLVTQADMVTRVWGQEFLYAGNPLHVLQVNIYRIRPKLPIGIWIENIGLVGYRLHVTQEEA